MKTILVYAERFGANYDGFYRSLLREGRVRGWRFAWLAYRDAPDEPERIARMFELLKPAGFVGGAIHGIAAAVPGNHLGDIGFAVQSLAEKNGFGVVREYVGHGVGRDMHEDPNVPNFGKKGRGVRLQVGMCIAIEPMITLGTYKNHTLANGWTVVTNDGKPAAHYENTIAITKDGPVILTQDVEGPWCDMQGGA